MTNIKEKLALAFALSQRKWILKRRFTLVSSRTFEFVHEFSDVFVQRHLFLLVVFSLLLQLLLQCWHLVATVLQLCEQRLLLSDHLFIRESSQMNNKTATVRVVVAATRCQYWWSHVQGGIYTPTPSPPSGHPQPLERSWDQAYIPPPLWTDRHLWKHYLPATTVAGGKNFPHLVTEIAVAHVENKIQKNVRRYFDLLIQMWKIFSDTCWRVIMAVHTR